MRRILLAATLTAIALPALAQAPNPQSTPNIQDVIRDWGLMQQSMSIAKTADDQLQKDLSALISDYTSQQAQLRSVQQELDRLRSKPSEPKKMSTPVVPVHPAPPALHPVPHPNPGVAR